MENGHRQQKKQQTYFALLTSAFKLFAERGYDKTTIADIAALANVAPRTFFLYFTAKEELLPAAIQEARTMLTAHLSDRGDSSTLDALHGWARNMLQNHQTDNWQGALIQDPSFQARKKFYMTTLLRPVLAKEFAKDLNVPAESTQPQLLATLALAVIEDIDFNQAATARTAYVDNAIALLKVGMSALK